MSRNPIPQKAAISPPPLPALLPSVIVTAVLSLALGYWVGVGNSFLSFGSSKRPRIKRRSASDDGASSSSEISSEDETDLADNRLRGVSHEECKLVRFLNNFGILMLGFGRANGFRNEQRESCNSPMLPTLTY
jgi:hypothetical protein